MDMNWFACSLVVIWTSLQIGNNYAVRIEVHPDTFNTITTESVHIHCAMDNRDKKAREILILEITKDGNSSPIVFLRHGSHLSYSNENDTHLKAEGHIDKDIGQSYLNLTLLSPKSTDSGVYTCIMYLLDENAILKKETSSKNITENDVDTDSIMSILKNMKEKIADLEKKSDEKDSIVENRMSTIEKKSDILSLQMTDLTDKVTYTTSFAATRNADFYPQIKQVIVFSDLMYQNGTDFNPKTGIFTASRAGLYSFSLIASIDDTKEIHINIQRNDKTLVVLRTWDRSHEDQSSVTIVTSLNAGDIVKNVVVYMSSGTKLYGGHQNVFSGFLVRPY